MFHCVTKMFSGNDISGGFGARQPRLDFTDTKYDKPINLVVVQVKD